MTIIERILTGVFLLVFYGIPVLTTILNTVNFFIKKPVLGKLLRNMTYFLYLIFLLIISSLSEYNIPITLNDQFLSLELHTPLSLAHMMIIFTLIGISFIGQIVLKVKAKELPPLLKAVLFSAVCIGVFLNVAIVVQLFKNAFYGDEFVGLLLILLPVNYILYSIRILREVIITHLEKCNTEAFKYKSKMIKLIYVALFKSTGWYFIGFALMIPLLFIIFIILLIFGQTPDSIIHAFTETSDWTFSQKVSPPPVEYIGHYLCTVAVNGHEKIVKPTRIGIRQNIQIVVNRQLCVANAFEELIEEKAPGLHRLIRKNYDKYGYPISKHINTKFKADFMYILMKPLEWLFLMVLYTFDTKPENRIAMQYRGN